VPPKRSTFVGLTANDSMERRWRVKGSGTARRIATIAASEAHAARKSPAMTSAMRNERSRDPGRIMPPHLHG
jgi:hypothetical protein